MQQEQPNLKISTAFWCLFISMFPVVGLIYLIVTACSKQINKRNLARGLLLFRASIAVFGALSIAGIILILDHMI